MTLREWWASKPRNQKKKLKQSLADLCEVETDTVHNWIFGVCLVPGKYAEKVISFTDGEVTLGGLYADA